MPRRHRFYRHLFVVTVFLFAILALPTPIFRIHLVGTALLQLLLLSELGEVIPSRGSPNATITRHDRRAALAYRLLGLVGIGVLIIWMFTPFSTQYTGLPVFAVITPFVFWSLKRLLGLLSREQSVSGEVIVGAVAGYLLLGISGGLLLTVLETLNPGSFQNLVHEGRHINERLFVNHDLSRLIWDQDFSRINYFAFVCLTTTGFGDIVPVRPSAEMAAVSISIAGSLYLALVMGLLISRLTVQTQLEEERHPLDRES